MCCVVEHPNTRRDCVPCDAHRAAVDNQRPCGALGSLARTLLTSDMFWTNGLTDGEPLWRISEHKPSTTRRSHNHTGAAT